jgi:hypothetical protein
LVLFVVLGLSVAKIVRWDVKTNEEITCILETGGL